MEIYTQKNKEIFSCTCSGRGIMRTKRVPRFVRMHRYRAQLNLWTLVTNICSVTLNYFYLDVIDLFGYVVDVRANEFRIMRKLQIVHDSMCMNK